MKIAVVGLWHLGSVTSACLANLNFNIIGIDDNRDLVNNYNKDILPIYEPGLKEMTLKAREKGTLKYTTDIEQIADVDVVWVTYDTPVNDNDEADPEYVKDKIVNLFQYIKEGCVLLVSSQLPVGSIDSLKKAYENIYGKTKIHFACSPENLRLGDAISVFLHPDRIVVGVSSEEAKQKLSSVLFAITNNIIWMSTASAEMTKHAINAFLAASIVFINEVASICEQVGADASEVEQGLKSEQRIGPKSYLKPGNAFAGGTLARDLDYLVKKNVAHNMPASYFQSIISSNSHHRDWAKNAIRKIYPDLSGKIICVLGLTYKPGTNTLRRSQSVELCKWLSSSKAIVNAYDPVIKSLTGELSLVINLFHTSKEALSNADIIVVATEWPQFLDIIYDDKQKPRKIIVIDANGFLKKTFENSTQIIYYRIGKVYETKE